MLMPRVLLASLLTLFMASSGAALQNVPDVENQLRWRGRPAALPVRDFEICIVGMAGRFSCLRKQQVRDRLASLDGRDRELISGMLDRLNASVGNRTVNDMLVHCMGEWRGVRSPNPGIGSASSDLRRPRSNMLEQRLASVRTDAIRNACTAGTPAAGRPGSIPTNPGYDRQVANVVAGFGEATTSCRDPDNSLIAQYRSGGPTLDEIRFVRELERHDYRPLVQLLHQLNEALEPFAQAAQAANERRERAADLAALERAAAIAAREPQEQAAKQCLEATQCMEPEPETGTQTPLPPGIGSGASCAEKQARWNRFNERCARSDWRSFECVAFVRRLNGCVDMTRILPGPDGDLTCPVPQSEAARQALIVQDQCHKIGLIGRRTREGGFHCGSLPPVARPGSRIDICRDPRVMPEPGRCP